MKVVLIYRKSRPGVYSIEELFHTIADELSKQVEVIEYEAGTRWNIFRDVWQLRKLKADIYHVTGDINYLVHLLPSDKTVLTVHDIGHYLFDLSGVKRWLYKWIWLTLPIRSATAVTTVSKETRENIVNHLDIKDKFVEVIENCHSATFKPVTKPFSAECPVILQVGTKLNKNVSRLVGALKGVRCNLVLIGSIDDKIKQKLTECGIAFEYHVGVTHEEIYKQYIKCDLVSFISLSEGFGVPIIEAQAIGRPVITSNRSPMKDVAGDSACLVDPLSVIEIHDGIQRILSVENYRNQLIENGLKNVTRYSPTTISAKYLALYKRLVSA